MKEKIKNLRFDTQSSQDFFIKKLAYTIGPNQLKELMENDDIKLIDVRSTEEFNNGHIPTAISMPIDQIDQNLEKLSKEKITVVYGCNEFCSGATKGCLILADYGYPCIMMRGGFMAWSKIYRYAIVNE